MVVRALHRLEKPLDTDCPESINAIRWIKDALYEVLMKISSSAPHALSAVQRHGDEQGIDVVRRIKEGGHDPNVALCSLICEGRSYAFTTPTCAQSLRVALALQGCRSRPDESEQELRRRYDELENVCPICMEEFKDGDIVCSVGCGHVEHTVCLKRFWLAQSCVSGCPICRAGFTNDRVCNQIDVAKAGCILG